MFPGTNSEWDMAAAFERAGAITDIFVINNLTPKSFEESLEELAKRINNVQIIALSGGASAGDEPEGSAKFINAIFNKPVIAEAAAKLLDNRKGLMIGICNGFQALLKLGLVPFGKITPITKESPALTYNSLGRHVSLFVDTRIISNMSPWLAGVEVGDVHTVAASHGQGRFVCDTNTAQMLFDKGQVAAVYADHNGNPALSLPYNPNGSVMGIEALTDPTGRILGKMGHSERVAPYKNIKGNFEQKIFKSGIKYFM